MKRWKQALGFIGLGYMVLASQTALSIFDAQLLLGQRSAKTKVGTTSSTLDASEVQFAVHVDPIPLIPVGAGIYVLSDDYSVSDSDGYKSLKSVQYGFELTAWLPIDVADLTPFIKIGVGIAGAMTGDQTTTSIEGVDYTPKVLNEFSSASRVAVGGKWSPLAIVSVLLQVEQATEKWKSKTEVAGVETAGGSFSVDGTTFLIGVEAGL